YRLLWLYRFEGDAAARAAMRTSLARAAFRYFHSATHPAAFFAARRRQNRMDAPVPLALAFFLRDLRPDLRASLRAIATACLRLFTFLPLPDFSVPSLCSFMTLWTLLRPLAADFVAMIPPGRLFPS